MHLANRPVQCEFQVFLKINLLSAQIHYFVDFVGLSQRFGLALEGLARERSRPAPERGAGGGAGRRSRRGARRFQASAVRQTGPISGGGV